MPATSSQTADRSSLDWGEHHEWIWRGPRCHWRCLGPEQGQPLLLLHGFGASSEHWRLCAPSLAERGYRVFSLDLIGFGRSEQPGLAMERPLDNRLWGRQVSAFLQEIIQQPCVLIGNSLGGLTALTAAVLDPSRVAVVVAAPLPDPAFVTPVGSRRGPLRRRCTRWGLKVLFKILPLELLLPFIGRTPLLRAGLQGAYSSSIRNDFDLLRSIRRPVLRPTAARALRSMCIGMGLRPRGATAPALLQQMHQPMLLIWGVQDRFVPFALGKQIQQQTPTIDLASIDYCGHCPHDECTESFIEQLLPWLDRNLGKRRPAGPDHRR